MKRKHVVRWPKPDEHRLMVKERKLREDSVVYTNTKGEERVAFLDHSRCEPLRPGAA